MEPISIIMSALIVGISQGLKPTAAQAVKDGYQGLKTIIEKTYDINLKPLENKPESEAQKNAIKESLEDASADQNDAIVKEAIQLLETLNRIKPESLKNIGVKIEGLRAGKNITIGDITGPSIDINDFEADESINLGNISADGNKGSKNPN